MPGTRVRDQRFTVRQICTSPLLTTRQSIGDIPARESWNTEAPNQRQQRGRFEIRHLHDARPIQITRPLPGVIEEIVGSGGGGYAGASGDGLHVTAHHREGFLG